MTASGGARFVFVAGKGGVGKTTWSAATAVRLAQAGDDVLVVSTDPAHSLGDALDVPLTATPTTVPLATTTTKQQKKKKKKKTTTAQPQKQAPPGALHALHLDADAALRRFLREKRRALRLVVGRGTYFDDADIDGFLDLSFPGVDEFVGLVELLRVADESGAGVVVVDTAPTGHLLRLLEMPETLARLATVLDDMQEKHRVVASSLGGRSGRVDVGDALVDELRDDAARLRALLRDGARCSFVQLTLPEPLSVAEAGDSIAALRDGGLVVDRIVVNRVVGASACAFCGAQQRAQQAVLREVAAAFDDVDRAVVAALDVEPRGVSALARLRETSFPPLRRTTKRAAAPTPKKTPPTSTATVSLVSQTMKLILVMGKGGVGKTSVATALCLAAAQPQKSQQKRQTTLLLSADPAHSLKDVLGGDDVGGLGVEVREVDAGAGFADLRARYRDRVNDLFDRLQGGSRFDAVYDRAVVEDLFDLAPPGLDELLALLTVIDALFDQRTHDRVVVDCAPTGHALRLLQMPALALEWVHGFLALLLKYKDVVGLSDVARELLTTARQLKALIALLHDPAACGVVVVTRPAQLPVAETARLLGALDDAAVPVAAVVVNGRSVGGSCPRCRRRRAAEDAALAALPSGGAGGVVVEAPLLPVPPVGVAALSSWQRRWVFAPRPR